MEKFNFNLKHTAIFRAIKLEKYFRTIELIKKIFLALFIIGFFLFLYKLSYQSLSSGFPSKYLALSIIFLIILIVFWQKLLFFNQKIKKPEILISIDQAFSQLEKYNLAEFLNFDSAKAFWQAFNYSQKKKLFQVPAEAILYFSLQTDPRINFIFSRGLLNLKEIKKELRDYLKRLEGENFQRELSPESQEVVLEAGRLAQERGRRSIKPEDIIVVQSKTNPILKKYLIAANLKYQDFENLALWLESLEKDIERRKKFWSQENLVSKPTLGKEWAAGYTLNLDKYSTNWTEAVKQRRFGEIIGHQREIESIERILDRSEINNVLLVGDPGSGRNSIVKSLSRKIVFGKSIPSLNYKKVVELDMASLIAQTEGLEETEKILDKIFEEAVMAGNIILVINDFHNYISHTAKPGVIDISGVILNYLALPQFQIIALTSPVGLHKYIEQNPSVLNLFEQVEVSEISPEETLVVLENTVAWLERKYKKFISYQSMREVIYFGERYMPAIPFPKKALDLLDEVLIYVRQSTKDFIVLPQHVARIVSEKTQIPVGNIETKEKKILLNLENLIHQRIINQEQAVREVATALRRARAEVTIKRGPIGSFLFLGPTGVGKTETSKALAEFYFGSESQMIRLDMSEFQNIQDIPRLLGSPGEEGLLTTKVMERPFSLILLDELEKAHPNILNLFLQVLDEGHLTDGLGRKVDFKNCIIIATSNAGYKIILQALEEKIYPVKSPKGGISPETKLFNGASWSNVKEKLLKHLFDEGIYRPEFINRFDAVVVFSPLNKKNLLDIAGLLFYKLQENLKKKDIDLIISEKLKENIVELSYNPIFGAREMKRVIQDKVENILATALLSGELKKGERVKIDPENFKLIIGS